MPEWWVFALVFWIPLAIFLFLIIFAPDSDETKARVHFSVIGRVVYAIGRDRLGFVLFQIDTDGHTHVIAYHGGVDPALAHIRALIRREDES